MNPVRPVIGITCHLAQQPGPSGHNRSFHRLSAQYGLAVRDAGGLPVLLGTAGDWVPVPSDALPALDGLLLSGGTDLPAGSFTDRLRPTLRETDPVRYDYETALVRDARRRGLPMMGICRGHQTLVEALGGRLILNIAGEHPQAHGHYQAQPPAQPSHAVAMSAGTRMHQWLGEQAVVNSFHRQAVAEVPHGFSVAAVSDDDLVEAVEADDGFVLGVQFHPEWLYPDHPEFLRLFQAFVAAAAFSSSVHRRLSS